MQTRFLVVLVLLFLVAIPLVGCADLIPTPNVLVTWTPTGDVDGNEFPEDAVVTQTVEYSVDGVDNWLVVDGAEDVPYLGTGTLHEAHWTLPDMQAYGFRVAVRVLWQGVTFTRYCETRVVQYFGIGSFECDADGEPEE